MWKDAETIKEAARRWVNEFDAIPESVIMKLAQHDEFSLTDITPPVLHDRVYVYLYLTHDNDHYGEIVKIDGDLYTVEMDNSETMDELTEGEFELANHGEFPMWGTMWHFSDPCDEYWLTDNGGLQIMAECGFRIFEQEDYDHVFGIDGAGYDFYEAHWIPLYKARGLQWHKEGAPDE